MAEATSYSCVIRRQVRLGRNRPHYSRRRMQASAKMYSDWQDNQASPIPAHGVRRQPRLEARNKMTERFHPSDTCPSYGNVNMSAQNIYDVYGRWGPCTVDGRLAPDIRGRVAPTSERAKHPRTSCSRKTKFPRRLRTPLAPYSLPLQSILVYV